MNGREVSLAEVLYSLKLANGLDAIREGLGIAVVLDAIKREGITVTDAELQSAADKKRQGLGLHRAVDTQRWLRENALNLDDFETLIWRQVASDKLKAAVTAGKVDAYFAKNRPQFDTAKLSQIIVRGESAARDLIAKVKAGEDFATLARQSSVDRATADVGGYVGWRARAELSPNVAKAVFSAVDGDVVGPILSDDMALIVRVEKIQRAQLNEETRAAVVQAVFREWIDAQRRAANVEFLLPSEVSGR
jgi:parvulin-like peptidyl-prolyl isomerase